MYKYFSTSLINCISCTTTYLSTVFRPNFGSVLGRVPQYVGAFGKTEAPLQLTTWKISCWSLPQTKQWYQNPFSNSYTAYPRTQLCSRSKKLLKRVFTAINT